MNLCIDIGNTRAKAGLFINGKLEGAFELERDGISQKATEIKPEHIIVSSVSQDVQGLCEDLHKIAPTISLSAKTPMPIRLAYETPETLGVDRVAGVAGAHALTNGPALVIDLGTCVTFDIIDATGNYLGGSISPGWSMRLKAMRHFTQRLPLLDTPEALPELTGTRTDSAMRSGATHGLRLEIEGIIREYRKKFRDLTVFLCGGDSVFFGDNSDAETLVTPELVLIGLNSILTHNVEANV